MIQHMEDNLNQNFTNKQHLENFLKVARSARAALKEKYSEGGFMDPGDFDPQEEPEVTWANKKM